MALKDVPIIGNVISFFNKDGTEMTDKETAEAIEGADEKSAFEDCEPASETELEENGYGKDAGDRFVSQAGTAALGGFLGYQVADRLSGGNKLIGAIGLLAGAVVMHKIGPELITDIQRGNQYVDQQKELGKSEGKLSDRFAAVVENFKTKGQSVTPDPDVDIDV